MVRGEGVGTIKMNRRHLVLHCASEKLWLLWGFSSHVYLFAKEAGST
jgi:hypothetical protein